MGTFYDDFYAEGHDYGLCCELGMAHALVLILYMDVEPHDNFEDVDSLATDLACNCKPSSCVQSLKHQTDRMQAHFNTF
jgi:hypothetical protein